MVISGNISQTLYWKNKFTAKYNNDSTNGVSDRKLDLIK